MVRSAILLTLAGVILGCNTRESTISERDSNPAIKAAVDATKIPVLYCPHFHPAKLTETQLNSVLTLTAESQYDSPIWFIFVWYHHNGHYRVEVFYVPDHDDALRRGKSVFIASAVRTARAE